MLIHPCERVQGDLTVPGDKAISHRALLIGAGAEEGVAIRGLSPAEDVASSLRALLTLGRKAFDESGSVLEGSKLSSTELDFLKLEGHAAWHGLLGGQDIDCGNSGTTMRLLMGILAGGAGTTTLTGDGSLSRRPMRRVADPLAAMGADISLSDAGTAPAVIRGTRLFGIDYRLPVPSAQVKTALLLAGLQADGETRVSEPVATRDHTERMLAHLGAPLRSVDGALIVGAARLFGDKEISIPGDFSSASFLLTASAILPDSEVVVRGVGLNPTRTAFLEVLRRYGARVEVSDETELSGEPRGNVQVRPGERRPLHVAAEEVPGLIDELPLVAVLAAFAEGDSEIRGAAELRVKESDRIAAVVAALRGMGGEAEELPDGFVVRGTGGLPGGRVDSVGDHRIAMAFAVAGLGATEPTRIDRSEAVAVSYPGFAGDLRRISPV